MFSPLRHKLTPGYSPNPPNTASHNQALCLRIAHLGLRSEAPRPKQLEKVVGNVGPMKATTACGAFVLNLAVWHGNNISTTSKSDSLRWTRRKEQSVPAPTSKGCVGKCIDIACSTSLYGHIQDFLGLPVCT